MPRFAILLAGPIRPTPELRARVAGCRAIAADRGMTHAAALGLRPELWVGDFDSADPATLARAAAVPREAFPRAKDRTDGEIAIEAAIARGADDLLLVGALGGPRFDHAFAHLVLLMRHAERGLAVAIDDGDQRAAPLLPGGGETRVAAVPGAPFSILRFGAVEGLSIEGARWPLDRVDLPFESILTQSNEATAETVTVRLATGRAVIVVQAGAEPD